MSQDLLDQLSLSWRTNAQAWTQAVRSGQIESRRLVTDAAIVQATLAHRPRRVLDIGCGEGWLCRALASHGIEVVGIDASAELIAAACTMGGDRYHTLSYAALSEAADRLGHFDALVCNFALLEENLGTLLTALRTLLNANGVLLIQTVHPWTARGDAGYWDGWRTETFANFGSGFGAAMPWFYRTLESWITALGDAGWHLQSLTEPLHPQSELPASLLICATKSRP